MSALDKSYGFSVPYNNIIHVWKLQRLHHRHHTGANVHLARIKPDIVCMRVYKLCMCIYWFGRHAFGCVRVRPTCTYTGKINSIISSSALTARTSQSSVPITRVHQAIHNIMPSCLCYNRDHYTQNNRMLDKLSPPVNWCWCANRMLCGWDEIISGLGVQCVNMFCCVRFVGVLSSMRMNYFIRRWN